MSLPKASMSALDRAGEYWKSIGRKSVWVNACKRWGLAPIPLGEGLVLWLGWAGLTWLAFGLSLTVIEVGERGDISFADGVLGGGLVGLAQWLVIRPYLRRSHRWIWVSALCWGALALLHIGAIGWIAPNTPNLVLRALFGLFYGFYGGLVLGVGQWWVMRPNIVRAWRWALLSAGIWSVSMAFGWLIGGGLRLMSNLFVAEVLGLVVAWGLIAALSGIAVVGMLLGVGSSRTISE